MLIHFVAPTPKYADNIHTYLSIFKAVTSEGHTLTRDFGAEAATQIEMGLDMLDQDEWEMICQRELDYLTNADVLIVDATDKSTFGVGYQTALALSSNKPTLVLLRETSLGGSFISGLLHGSLARRTFTDGNVYEVVCDYLRTLKERMV